MDTLWKNFTYSLRMLLKRPSLTIVAIIAIALVPATHSSRTAAVCRTADATGCAAH